MDDPVEYDSCDESEGQLLAYTVHIDYIPEKVPDNMKFLTNSEGIYSPQEEYDLITKQVKESEGFDIDFTQFRCIFNFRPVFFDRHAFVSEPEGSTDVDLLNQLSEDAINRYNEKEDKSFEFVKVIKANFYLCAGIMFFITFEAKDPCNDDQTPKLFQAKTRHFFSYGTFFEYCRLKPNQKD